MGKFIQIINILFLVSVISFIWLPPALSEEIPVPEYKISQQGDLPDELKPFLGRWEGQWNPGPKMIMIIEKISPEEKKCRWSVVGAHGKI